MTLFIVVCLVIVGAWGVMIARAGRDDRDLLVPLGAIVVVVLCFLAWPAIDYGYYHRRAFAAVTACESQRMEARRKAMSTEVVCVPAYRATKADTLTVQTPDLKR